jgi:putative alpha-1,2-mannosidase
MPRLAGRDDVVFREGRGLVAVFDFGVLPSAPVLVKVAISAVSEEGALRNLDEEVPQWDFDARRAAAAAAWRKALAALDIEAAEPMSCMLYVDMGEHCKAGGMP